MTRVTVLYCALVINTLNAAVVLHQSSLTSAQSFIFDIGQYMKEIIVDKFGTNLCYATMKYSTALAIY